MKALEQFNAGNIDDAVAEAIAEVKSNPTSIPARLVLAQMLCFQGDLERADKHLEASVVQAPEQSVQFVLYRQLLRAETARKECLTQGRVPEMIGEPSEARKLQVEALIHLRNGDFSQVQETLAKVEEIRPRVSGTCNDVEFQDVRDQDDLCASFLEVLTSTGKYYWIGFDQIETMQCESSSSPWDLMWRQVEMVVKDGPNGIVYIPIGYFPFSTELNVEQRLARSTEWVEESGFARGIGQRLFWFDGDEKSILEINNIQFTPTE